MPLGSVLAYQLNDFHSTMEDGVAKLRHDHKSGYYAQVQGQLALSGLKWCDLVTYLSGSHTITVERIFFDNQYWNNILLPKLTNFYFSHALPYLDKKYFKSN